LVRETVQSNHKNLLGEIKPNYSKLPLKGRKNSEIDNHEGRNQLKLYSDSKFDKGQRKSVANINKKIHPVLAPSRYGKKARISKQQNFIPTSTPGKKFGKKQESRPTEVKRKYNYSAMKSGSRDNLSCSAYTSRSTMRKSLYRNGKSIDQTLKRGSQVVDVK